MINDQQPRLTIDMCLVAIPVDLICTYINYQKQAFPSHHSLGTVTNWSFSLMPGLDPYSLVLPLPDLATEFSFPHA